MQHFSPRGEVEWSGKTGTYRRMDESARLSVVWGWAVGIILIPSPSHNANDGQTHRFLPFANTWAWGLSVQDSRWISSTEIWCCTTLCDPTGDMMYDMMHGDRQKMKWNLDCNTPQGIRSSRDIGRYDIWYNLIWSDTVCECIVRWDIMGCDALNGKNAKHTLRPCWNITTL